MPEAEKTFIKITDAAKLLRCPAKKVHELCDQGMIRRHFEGNDAYVHHEDIADLARFEVIGEMRPGEMVRRLLLLETKVSQLESAFNIVLDNNGMSSSRFLRMDDSELSVLYLHVVQLLDSGSLEVDEIDGLAITFVKLNEVDVERLNELLSINNSWLPFFQLCIQMLQSIGQHRDLAVSEQLRTLYAKLQLAKKNLGHIAIISIERAALMAPAQNMLKQLLLSEVDTFDAMAMAFKKRGGLSLVTETAPDPEEPAKK